MFLLLAGLGLALLAYFQANPHQVPDGQTIYDNADQMFTRFIAIGLPAGFGGLVVAGLVWNAWFPINKGLWTSSYVLFTGGLAFQALASQPEHGKLLERIQFTHLKTTDLREYLPLQKLRLDRYLVPAGL